MLFLLFLALLGLACAGTYPIAGPMNSTLESTTCGGNCPGGCDSCPCGSSSSYQSASSWYLLIIPLQRYKYLRLLHNSGVPNILVGHKLNANAL